MIDQTKQVKHNRNPNNSLQTDGFSMHPQSIPSQMRLTHSSIRRITLSRKFLGGMENLLRNNL